MKMKTIQLEIPDGKEAKWVDGVLTLVDEQPKDITERIKTFEDACNELGDDHHFVIHYKEYYHYVSNKYLHDAANADILAYLKLRIITAALNEGWGATTNNCGWYASASHEDFGHCIGTEFITGVFGTKLTFKSDKLAEYAANQFADIYADFYGTPKGGQQ